MDDCCDCGGGGGGDGDGGVDDSGGGSGNAADGERNSAEVDGLARRMNCGASDDRLAFDKQQQLREAVSAEDLEEHSKSYCCPVPGTISRSLRNGSSAVEKSPQDGVRSNSNCCCYSLPANCRRGYSNILVVEIVAGAAFCCSCSAGDTIPSSTSGGVAVRTVTWRSNQKRIRSCIVADSLLVDSAGGTWVADNWE